MKSAENFLNVMLKELNFCYVAY